MKRFAVIVLAVIALLFVSLGVLLHLFMRRELRHLEERVAADFERSREPFTAELRYVVSLPVFARRDGGDASSLVLAHVPPTVPPSLRVDCVQWKRDWVLHVADARVDELDLEWMSKLSTFGFLELDAAPLDVWAWVHAGRVRLMRGLRDDDLPRASAEVRELARLMISSETPDGFAVAVHLLGVEAEAHARAVESGMDVMGIEPVDEEGRRRMSRVFNVVRDSRSLMSSPPYSELDLGALHCLSLQTGLTEAHEFERLLHTAMRPRYAALERELETSNCRLTRARQRVLHPDASDQRPVSLGALCGGEQRARCERHYSAHSLAWLPFVRFPLGVMGLSIKHLESPFAHYAAASP